MRERGRDRGVRLGERDRREKGRDSEERGEDREEGGVEKGKNQRISKQRSNGVERERNKVWGGNRNKEGD